jgi:hypothetical protein
LKIVIAFPPPAIVFQLIGVPSSRCGRGRAARERLG